MLENEKVNAINYYNDYLAKVQAKKKIVSSSEYWDWVISQLNDVEAICDENYFYFKEEGIDKSNGSILSHFHSYIAELAEAQMIIPNREDDPSEFSHIFIYKEQFFEISTIHGQGSITIVRKLKSDESLEDNAVLLGEYKSLNENKLSLYIMIPKDASIDESLANNIATITSIETVKEVKTSRFSLWFKHEKKIEFIRVSTDILRTLENKGYTAIKTETGNIAVLTVGFKKVKEFNKLMEDLHEVG